MNNAQLIADLKATKYHLAQRGRCRGALESLTEEGKVCLDGAVALAVRLDLDSPTSYLHLRKSARARAVMQALADQIPYPFIRQFDDECTQVWVYNDSKGVTDQDCFDLINKALAHAGGLG